MAGRARGGAAVSSYMIAMNLSDGSACYGRCTAAGKWWLRRVRNATDPTVDAAAPDWARRAAENALKRGGWEYGGVVEISYS